jgi:hypothetical protein
MRPTRYWTRRRTMLAQVPGHPGLRQANTKPLLLCLLRRMLRRSWVRNLVGSRSMILHPRHRLPWLLPRALRANLPYVDPIGMPDLILIFILGQFLTYTPLCRAPQDIDPDSSTQNFQPGGESPKADKAPTLDTEKMAPKTSESRAQVELRAPQPWSGSDFPHQGNSKSRSCRRLSQSSANWIPKDFSAKPLVPWTRIYWWIPTWWWFY